MDKKRIFRILEERVEKSRWQRVARYKLESEVKGGRYWEEERLCRLCAKMRRRHRNTYGMVTENGKKLGKRKGRKPAGGDTMGVRRKEGGRMVVERAGEGEKWGEEGLGPGRKGRRGRKYEGMKVKEKESWRKRKKMAKRK